MESTRSTDDVVADLLVISLVWAEEHVLRDVTSGTMLGVARFALTTDDDDDELQNKLRKLYAKEVLQEVVVNVRRPLNVVVVRMRTGNNIIPLYFLYRTSN